MLLANRGGIYHRRRHPLGACAPSGPVEINWNCSLTERLEIAVVNPWEGELVRGRDTYEYAGQGQRTSYRGEWAHVPVPGGSSAWRIDGLPHFEEEDGYTNLVRAYRTEAGSSTFLDWYNTSDSQKGYMQLYVNNEWGYQTDFLGSLTTNSNTAMIGSVCNFAGVVEPGNANTRLYSSGGTQDKSSSTDVDIPVEGGWARYGSITAGEDVGAMYWLAWVGRALLPDELDRLFAWPYEFLLPAKRFWHIPATGGPAIHEHVASGGYDLAGAAPQTHHAGFVGVGGTQLAGAAGVSHHLVVGAVGGVQYSGTGDVAFHVSTLTHVGSGGLQLGGQALVSTIDLGGGPQATWATRTPQLPQVSI